MAPGVPGGLIEPLIFGTIAGAGIPPIAALSPGIPSSTGESNAPPAQSGCRHPNTSHPGSSWTASGRSGMGTPRGLAFAGTVAPIMAIPAIAAATAVLVNAPLTSEAVIAPIGRSSQ
jgi:hypothetical protein